MKIKRTHSRTLRYWGLASLMACLGWSASAAQMRNCPATRSIKHYVHPPLSRLFTRAQTDSPAGYPAKYGPIYQNPAIVPPVPSSHHWAWPPSEAPPTGLRLPVVDRPGVACSTDPLSLSLARPPGQIMDAPQSPPGWLPSALKPLAPVQSDQLCPGFQINQAIDPSKWDAPDAPGPLPSGARTEDGYADLRGLNIADVAALRDLPRCSSLKFFEMARAAGGDRLSGLTRDDAGWADGRSSAKANSLRSLNSPCLFASLQDQWSVAAGDCSLADVAVNCGTVNIHGLCATPEPSLCLTLGGFLIVAVGAKRRMNRRPDAIVA